jgi:hypothetical protein
MSTKAKLIFIGMLGLSEHHIEGIGWHELGPSDALNFVAQTDLEVIGCPAVTIVANADLSEDSSEFRVIFEDGTVALAEKFKLATESARIITTAEVAFESGDECFEIRKGLGRTIHGDEPLLSGFSQEARCNFNLVVVILGSTDVSTDLVNPPVDSGQREVLPGKFRWFVWFRTGHFGRLRTGCWSGGARKRERWAGGARRRKRHFLRVDDHKLGDLAAVTDEDGKRCWL